MYKYKAIVTKQEEDGGTLLFNTDIKYTAATKPEFITDFNKAIATVFGTFFGDKHTPVYFTSPLNMDEVTEKAQALLDFFASSLPDLLEQYTQEKLNDK